MEVQQEKHRVLVVDDEANVRQSLELLLAESYQVSSAPDAQAALEHLETGAADARPDVVLLDVAMPGVDGIELLKQLRDSYPVLPVIMLTASTNVQTAVQAMKIGAVDYLSKPYNVEELLQLIEQTIQQSDSDLSDSDADVPTTSQTQSRSRLAKVEGDFGALVGQHPVMQEIYQKVEQLAQCDTTVLVNGESGTGKELIAREIHFRSNRSNGPFVALNCAAIPETLVESELFGHEKGAFTHAVERRLGHFELADGGTLFLDEIGELSLAVQVKMLRFLQEQEFYRVGRSKPIRVDVRVIAATNKSLDTAVTEGNFREDLFYRINVVALEMPALRERRDDIPRLVDSFIERLSPVYGDRKPSLDESALKVLMNYAWPGNVRELENVTESILALCQKDLISEEDLPIRLRKSENSGGDIKEDVLGGLLGFEEANRVFETDIIVKALEKTGYVQTKAAELLGISRRILKYKMDKLGISDQPKAPGMNNE